MTRTILAMAALSVIALASVQTGAQSPGATSSGPTYSRDVAPILYKNCTNCHRPGRNRADVAAHIQGRPAVGEVDRRAGERRHDATLARRSRDRRVPQRSPSDAAPRRKPSSSGSAAGAPEGDPSDLPAPPQYAEGWTIGQPDAVLSMQEDYPIPASGTIAYQYFEVPTNFTEDKWIQAFEVRPGNRAVVHHVIVYTRPPAPAAPAAPPEPAGQPARRPAPLFTFADGHGYPGRPDRWPDVAPRSTEAARTERSAGAQDARPVDRRVRARQPRAACTGRTRPRASWPARR